MKNQLLVVIGACASVVAWAAAEHPSPDKYTVKVPRGLGFAEFKGYESWETIAVSNGGRLAVILGNPAMIDAYKAGIPQNGKPFPDGARMAKIHWNAKKSETE